MYGVVDKIGNGLQRLVAPHAPDIDLLLEMEFLLVHLVSCLLADEGALGHLFLDLVVADLLELVELEGALDHAKGHDRLLAVDGQDVARRGLSLEPDKVAFPDRLLVEPFRLFLLCSLVLALVASLDLGHLACQFLILILGRRDPGLELLERLPGQFGLFLVGLRLPDLPDRVLDLGVALGQEAFRLVLGLLDYLFPLLVDCRQLLLVACGDLLQPFFLLPDVLPLVLPITLVANDILQVFIHIDVVGAHLL